MEKLDNKGKIQILYCLIVVTTLKKKEYRRVHFIKFRGLPGVKSPPFRDWYGTLSEVISLINDIPFVICTATAMTSTKKKIYYVLCLANCNTFSVNMSPE